MKDLLSLSEGEINQLFREIKEAKKKKQKIKTMPIEQLENLIGAISIGGDAVKESEKYYLSFRLRPRPLGRGVFTESLLQEYRISMTG